MKRKMKSETWHHKIPLLKELSYFASQTPSPFPSNYLTGYRCWHSIHDKI